VVKNFLKIAFRNIWRSKGFSAINIIGLAIGMGSAIIILLWIQNEMSYDRFHEKGDRLYEAWNRSVFDGKLQCWSTTPKIMAPTLKQNYPEVEMATRVNWVQTILFSIDDRRLNIRGTMVDPDFLSMFSFPLVKGNVRTALRNTSSLVITQKLAKKLFGNADPVGKTVKIDNRDNCTVSAVMQDLPNNTQFDFEFLLPWEYMTHRGWSDSNWDNNSTQTFVLLKSNTSVTSFENKIRHITIQHTNGREKIEVFMYGVNKLRLYADFENGNPSGGRIVVVRVFAIIAGLILLIACINFMNLSTARSERRAKEVGIRKVVGAQKKSLIGQFLAESVLISLISGIIAIGMVQLALPAFNDLTQKQLSIGYGNLDFWLAGIAFIIFTGVLAGSYPAFFLSSFRPVTVLKGTFRKIHAPVTPRKVLVVMQFTFAIMLIIATVIIKRQIQYGQDRVVGYDRHNLGYVFLEGDIEKNYSLIKNELLSSAVATSVTKTSAPITEHWSDSWGFEWEGKDPNSKVDFNRYCVDGDLVKTAGVQVVQGRDMDLKNYLSDSTAIVLNQSAVAAMNFKHPIGQIIKDNGVTWHVIGVIKDFILESPYQPMRPMVIEGPKGWFNVMHIKLNNQNPTRQNLAKAEKIFKTYNPEYPFNFLFVDEQYEKKFSDEQLTGTLAGLFAGLTILISCLGLFGLATYMVENRIKEIGVRKVLGASVVGITALLSKDFLRLVFVAVLVASPIAWFAMDKWLQDFNYRITINWTVFVFAGLLASLVAVTTVSYQSIKAAIANPVKSLRSE
jgi:putative ABC transport system permease protein